MDTLERNTHYYKPPVRFQKSEPVQREQDALNALFERKHFPEMLELLYREKSIRQKDVVEALGINKAVVCQNMNELDAAGLVSQRKDGRCKTYYLSRKGAEYYERRFLSESEREPEIMAMPDEAKEIIRDSLGDGRPMQDAIVELLERLDHALDLMRRNDGEQLWMDEARGSLREAEDLVGAFRQVAERNNMLLYYYMGEFEAKLAWVKEGLMEPRGDMGQLAVTRSKHFWTILRLLFEEKSLYQKDIVERLGITRGNTSLHLRALVEAGFVDEGRDGVSKVYRLSEAGEEFFRENRPELARCSEPKETLVPVKAERQRTARKPVTVLNERNFSTIMRVLYETGGLPLTDLCARLERTHGNVYRDMRNLTYEGFVEKVSVRHCNFYSLSELGRDFCEACF